MSVIGAIASFGYSTIALGLSIWTGVCVHVHVHMRVCAVPRWACVSSWRRRQRRARPAKC